MTLNTGHCVVEKIYQGSEKILKASFTGSTLSVLTQRSFITGQLEAETDNNADTEVCNLINNSNSFLLYKINKNVRLHAKDFATNDYISVFLTENNTFEVYNNELKLVKTIPLQLDLTRTTLPILNLYENVIALATGFSVFFYIIDPNTNNNQSNFDNQNAVRNDVFVRAHNFHYELVNRVEIAKIGSFTLCFSCDDSGVLIVADLSKVNEINEYYILNAYSNENLDSQVNFEGSEDSLVFAFDLEDPVVDFFINSADANELTIHCITQNYLYYKFNFKSDQRDSAIMSVCSHKSDLKLIVPTELTSISKVFSLFNVKGCIGNKPLILIQNNQNSSHYFIVDIDDKDVINFSIEDVSYYKSNGDVVLFITNESIISLLKFV